MKSITRRAAAELGRRDALLVLGALLAFPVTLARAQSADELDRWRKRALALVNAARGVHGVHPLTLEASLSGAAQAHAHDMLKRRYLEHATPEGVDIEERYGKVPGKVWAWTGENIFTCSGCAPVRDETLSMVHRDWMVSEGHRENILAREFTAFGYGLAVGGRSLYAVQAFAAPGRKRRQSPKK